MALIDLNNAIRTKLIYSEKNTLDQVNLAAPPNDATYLDLHLDLVQMKTVGLGLSEAESGDILIDYDLGAIKNSIRNIFTTKKGQKILNPDFGCSLEQYLFTPISEANAKVIGGEIL